MVVVHRSLLVAIPGFFAAEAGNSLVAVDYKVVVDTPVVVVDTAAVVHYIVAEARCIVAADTVSGKAEATAVAVP